MSNNNSFGDRLKALRKSKKLTQVQVSEMMYNKVLILVGKTEL